METIKTLMTLNDDGIDDSAKYFDHTKVEDLANSVLCMVRRTQERLLIYGVKYGAFIKYYSFRLDYKMWSNL